MDAARVRYEAFIPLADHECEHGRLPSDNGGSCTCWGDWGEGEMARFEEEAVWIPRPVHETLGLADAERAISTGMNKKGWISRRKRALERRRSYEQTA